MFSQVLQASRMAPSTRNRASLSDFDRVLVRACVPDGVAVRRSQSTASLVVVCAIAGDGERARLCLSSVDASHFLSGGKISEFFQKSLELRAGLRSRSSAVCPAALGDPMGADSAIR